MRTLLIACLLGVPLHAEDAIHAALAAVEPGTPIKTERMTIVPLVRKDPLPSIGIRGTKPLSFEEPEFPKRQNNVVVRNAGDTPALLLGGTVLEGGRLDRIVARDHLVAPGKSAEVDTMTAQSDPRRRTAKPFRVDASIAPFYLRARAEAGGSDSNVRMFIARWLDFRDEGDRRRSLVAIANAKRLQEFAVPESMKLNRAAGVPNVVGGILAIDGRVQGLMLFGDPTLVYAHMPALIRGSTFEAAAIALRAGAAGVPIPCNGDRAKTAELVAQQAKELLAGLKSARTRRDDAVEGTLGETFLLRARDGTRARAVVWNGKLVSLAVFPRDPFRRRLYSPRLRPPSERTPDAEPEPTPEPERLDGTEINFIDRVTRRRRR
ncbi:MAG: DUF6569 family protein [Planctomycetota bacterium]